MTLLTLGIVLLAIGAVLIYFGRPREDVIYFGGVVLFIAGLAFVIIYLFNRADADAGTVDFVRSSWSHATELARSSWSHTTDVARSSWSQTA